jgi:hypothetical protein
MMSALVFHLACFTICCMCGVHAITKRTQATFLDTPMDYTVEVGHTAVLECAVSNLDDKKVIWRKASDSQPLTVGTQTFYNTERILVDHDPERNSWNLVIRQVRLSDNGVYECQVSSKVRHLRHHVLLTVKEALTTPLPRPDIKITGSSFVEKNGQIYLICNATGLEHPPDDLDWFFNGNKLTTQENRKVSIRYVITCFACLVRLLNSALCYLLMRFKRASF